MNKDKIDRNKAPFKTSRYQYFHFEDYWDYEKNGGGIELAKTRNEKYWLKYACCDKSRLTSIGNLEKNKGNLCREHHSEHVGNINAKPKGLTVYDNDEMMAEWSNRNTLNPRKTSMRSNKKAWFKCSVCGREIEQIISNRAQGKKCIHRDEIQQSKPEKILLNVIKVMYRESPVVDTYKVKDEISNRYITVDYYIPKLNLVIEFFGDYWHSSKILTQKNKLAKNAEEHHTQREINFNNVHPNTQFLYVWEYDWNNNIDLIFDALLLFFEEGEVHEILTKKTGVMG